jgi:Raf kinase inhibitor-like YbhB/YbcL family protein
MWQLQGRSGGALFLSAALVLAPAMGEACRADKSAPGGGLEGGAVAFQLSTTAFEDGGAIPKKFTCDGADVSPALAWSAPPAGTQSLALIVDDPDAPAGAWVHWVLYDLPGDARALAEGVPQEGELASGARQGRNDFGRIGYNGPCPPRGATHRYFFNLYALDSRMNLSPGASKGDLERAMKNHAVAQAETIGRFQH